MPSSTVFRAREEIPKGRLCPLSGIYEEAHAANARRGINCSQCAQSVRIYPDLCVISVRLVQRYFARAQKFPKMNCVYFRVFNEETYAAIVRRRMNCFSEREIRSKISEIMYYSVRLVERPSARAMTFRCVHYRVFNEETSASIARRRIN